MTAEDDLPAQVEGIDDFALAAGPADGDREQAVEAIQNASGSINWSAPPKAVDFAGTRWTPHLVTTDQRVLHLSLTGDIPKPFRTRMQAAAAAGYKVYFATTASGPDLTTLKSLQEIDARVLVIEPRDESLVVIQRRSVADWIAMHGIALTPEDLVELVRQRLDAGAGTGTNSARGRWYEEALCLLFSQVSWLRVREHAYRNASEEIDVVMSVHAAGYLAALAGGPIVIATAKNEDKATGSAVVKYLKEQMANRKGRCKLGFLCSATTISGDARKEILRGSQSNDLVIVPLDQATVSGLLDDPHRLDDEIEELITRAVAD